MFCAHLHVCQVEKWNWQDYDEFGKTHIVNKIEQKLCDIPGAPGLTVKTVVLNMLHGHGAREVGLGGLCSKIYL